MKYRKKPIVVEATRWFKNGDHPDDLSRRDELPEGQLPEGQVVRYYRTPAGDGRNVCEQCGRTMHDHGWIDTLEGGHVVCVGDWVITGIRGERYPCKDEIFGKTYEKA